MYSSFATYISNDEERIFFFRKAHRMEVEINYELFYFV